MKSDPTRSPPQEWLEHSGWLRELARNLVAEEDTADDLVQQTWLAALRHPPERGRPPRPWLARVLRNFALQRRRSESIRAQHELRSGTAELSPSAADVVARLESQRLLVEALLRLEEPYRETVVRHYFDGESSVHVARAKGIPAATVRWRLMRGLELLRIDLDGRAKGGRSAWTLALAPLVDSSSSSARVAPPAIPAIGGALAMQVGTKVGIAAALLLALLTGAWWLASRSPNISSASLDPADASVIPLREKQQAVIAAAEGESARSTIGGTGSEPSSTSQPAQARVEGRVVDEQRRGIPRASVRIVNWTGAPTSIADENGRFIFELAERADVVDERQRTWAELETDCSRFAPAHLGFRVAFDRITYLGEIALASAGVVQGAVVDGQGQPVEGAEVFAQILSDAKDAFPPATLLGRFEGSSGLRFQVDEQVPRTRTHPDGSFVFEDLPEGFVRLWATGPRALAAFSEPLVVHAGVVLTPPPLRLEAPTSERLIFGRVVAPDGSPVAGTIVTQRSSPALAGTTLTRTGDDGRFFVATPFKSAILLCTDPQKRWPQLVTKRIVTSKDEVEIRFQPWQLLTVRAVDESQALVKRFGVSVARAGGSEVFDSPTAEHPQGEVVVNIPHEAFRLIVYGPGLEVLNSDDLDPTQIGELMQVQMTRGQGVSGRVLAGGVPVEGARVAMLTMLAEGYYEEIEAIGASPSPILMRVLGKNTLEETTTDAAGRFFARLISNPSLLRIEAPGRAPFLRWKITNPIADLEIELLDGGSIEGRVQVPEGMERSGLLIGASCADGHVATCRTDDQGAYRFDRLNPGPWQVRRLEREQTPREERSTPMNWGIPVANPVFECEVVEGQTCRHDMGAIERPRLRGRLVIDGAPAGAWSARLTKLGKQGGFREPQQLWLDPDGEFEFPVSESGKYALDIEADPTQGSSLHVYDLVNIGNGTRVWDVELRTAVVSGAGDAQILGVDWYYAVTRLDGDRACYSMLHIANGQFAPTTVCAGKVHIVRLDDELGVFDSPIVKTIDVTAGASLEISLP